MPKRFENIPLIDDEQISLLREALDEVEWTAMCSQFPAAARQALDAIESGIVADDLHRVRREAHTLKGVAGSFGAARLSAVAFEIELGLDSIEAVANCAQVLVETARETIASLPLSGSIAAV